LVKDTFCVLTGVIIGVKMTKQIMRGTCHVVGIAELLSSRRYQLLGSKDTFCDAVAMIQLSPEEVKGRPDWNFTFS
jgi:hypothetical protein